MLANSNLHPSANHMASKYAPQCSNEISLANRKQQQHTRQNMTKLDMKRIHFLHCLPGVKAWKGERMCEPLGFQTGSVGQICHDTSNFLERLERLHWPGRISSLNFQHLSKPKKCVNCEVSCLKRKWSLMKGLYMRKFGNREGHAIPSHFKVKSGSAFPYPVRFGFWTLRKYFKNRKRSVQAWDGVSFSCWPSKKYGPPQHGVWILSWCLRHFETIMPTSLDPSWSQNQ